MFVRKVYFDKATGDVLESHMRRGDVVMTSFGRDAQELPSLAGRSQIDTGVFVWDAPDADVEAAFAAGLVPVVTIESDGLAGLTFSGSLA